MMTDMVFDRVRPNQIRCSQFVLRTANSEIRIKWRWALNKPSRPISTDAFFAAFAVKFAEKHAQKETHQSKSVRHIEKFAGRIVEVISTFRRANLLVVNTSPWKFVLAASGVCLSMTFVAKDLDIGEGQSNYLGQGEER